MDLKVLHRTALLTPPTISFKHSLPDNFVLVLSQLEPGLLVAERRSNRCIFHSSNLSFSFSKIYAGEKIRTDHLQAVAAGLVRP